ncbi:cAMP-dependent protein kinase catalytic subunit PRKX-like [Halichondria panicea]|uniref:cAMP-dependent protein kinase catalytic subunit PRKX-like n=1 Tax=Halichondria panicea TaxID=6063 RepID=UPI00312BAFF4
MAYIGESDMTDLSSTSGSSELGSPAGLQISSPQAQPMASALDLAHHLGQVSLDSSPVLAAKAAKFTRKYSLRELEIQQTIGTGTFGRVVLARDIPTGAYYALKIMTISEVIRLRQVEHVNSEKTILAVISHPFIVNMIWSHHDNRFLYMLLEYVSGGELFTYLRTAHRFDNTVGLFFASEIVMALDYLHSLHIVYRDLKPENILLDSTGHIKITDFGFAKKLVDRRTYTLCGTPEYLAPEIIQGRGHSKLVDWWALGILIYEMLVGYPPFFDEHPFRIYEKILEAKIDWPRHLEPNAKDLVKKLLVRDVTRRLGSLKGGVDDVKQHKWFKGVDWDACLQRKIPPPIVPRVTHPGDTRNFERYPEDGWFNVLPLKDADVEPFKDF